MSIFDRSRKPINTFSRMKLTEEEREQLGSIDVPDRATLHIEDEEELENRIKEQEDFAEWMDIQAEQQREYEENN